MNEKLSRRNFVGGAAVAAAAVAATAVGCSSTESTESVAEESVASTAESMTEEVASAPVASGKIAGADVPHTQYGAKDVIEWSWETTPEEITDIEETIETEVLVVGCGFAGVSAAATAAEEGKKVLLIEKFSSFSSKGAHIAAYGSNIVKQFASEGYFEETNYQDLVRRLTMWCHGRVKESLQWQFAYKSGSCMNWLQEKLEARGMHASMWDGYYKGPNYTEVPVTHVFYDDSTDFVYLDGVSHGIGMDIVVPAVLEEATNNGAEVMFNTKLVRLLREDGGPITGAIAENEDGGHIQINAESVILTVGDYLDDDEMRSCYAPQSWTADMRLYIPPMACTGEGHKSAMWIGAQMQKYEPHALVCHLEGGSQSYNFLHVNGLGKRFMNEDVNTQSKSMAKMLQPDDGLMFTIYDANGIENYANAANAGLVGGISSDQQYRLMGFDFDLELEEKLREAKVEQGLVFKADTIEDLADQMGVDADNLVATVARYNEMVAQGEDTDFGKRSDILWPIESAPFYAGKLVSTLLASYGGLRVDKEARVLDADGLTPIDGLYAAGLTAGEFYAEEYPTIVPGNSLGRCLTFGRIAGLNAAGKSSDDIESLDIEMTQE